MSDEREDGVEPQARVRELRCRRTGQMYTVPQHVRCPYCFGDEKRLRAGAGHDEFCDYEPGVDPIVFGFPQDGRRERSG
jgi:hypothetical protein